MENFTFFNPTRIEFGADKEQLIGQHLARHGVRKVLLCYGSERIKRDGRLPQAVHRQSPADAERVAGIPGVFRGRCHRALH